MAKLPTLDALGPRPEPQPGTAVAGYRATSGAETAPALALVQTGQALDSEGDKLYHAAKIEQEKQDTVRAEDAMNQAQQRALQLTFDEKDGFMSLKGANAIAPQVFPDYKAKLDDSAAQIAATLDNDEQRQKFKLRYDGIISRQYQEHLLRHSVEQRDVYNKSVFDGTEESGVNSIAVSFNDPNAVNLQIMRMMSAADRYAQDKGLAPEALDVMKQKILDHALTARFESWMYSDPSAAMSAFRENASKMSPLARLQLEGKLRERADAVDAKGVAQTAMGPAPAVELKSAISRTPLIEAVIQQESGGTNAVSPKGALGVMQVMPETGKMVAAKLGIPFDEKRLRNDPEYNKQIGTAYLQDQLTRFGGNQTLALAANNAGPEMVDDWINGTNKTGKNPKKLRLGNPASGEVTEAQFAANIPFQETRNYVASINALVAQTSPTTTRDTRAMLGTYIANAEKEAERLRPGDIVFRDKAIAQVKANVATVTSEQEGIQRQAQGQLIDMATGLRGGQKPLTESDLLSTPEGRRAWDLADPQARLGITGIIERNRREAELGAPMRSDPKVVNTLFSLIHLPDGDPKKVTTATQLTPFFANGLNRVDYDWLKKEVDAQQSVGGKNFSTDVQRARQSAHTMLTHSIVGTVQPEVAEEAAYRFSFDLQNKVDEYTKAGKDPRLLLTPGSPDYALKPDRVMSYMTSPQQQIAQQAKAITQGGAVTGQARVTPPSQYEVGKVYDFNQGRLKFKGGDPAQRTSWDPVK